MKLTPDLVPSFLRLIRPEDIENRARRFLAGANLDDYFIDSDGAAWIKGEPPTEMYLSIAGQVGPALLAEACERAWRAGATRLDVRTESSPLSDLLSSAGFTFRHARLEYQSPLAELPSEDGSPLKWRLASVEEAGRILERASLGDPDFDGGTDALKGWLADPDLTRGAECVQVAAEGIVIAQVNPATAWSRITYMGLLPEFRGRGLGLWVHRRGFAMMRNQGGNTYVGGTVESNRPMIRLFESHGCRFLRRLEEWRATRS